MEVKTAEKNFEVNKLHHPKRDILMCAPATWKQTLKQNKKQRYPYLWKEEKQREKKREVEVGCQLVVGISLYAVETLAHSVLSDIPALLWPNLQRVRKTTAVARVFVDANLVHCDAEVDFGGGSVEQTY